MSLDTLLSVVRASACLAGPLATSGDIYADGGGTAKPMSGMMSPASEQVQQLQGQGILDGRRATLMLGETTVTTALGRALRPGDEWRVASGSYIGTWVVETANLVRGGWQRADLRWERMATTTSAQEKR
jgi:hypothetical protein